MVSKLKKKTAITSTDHKYVFEYISDVILNELAREKKKQQHIKNWDSAIKKLKAMLPKYSRIPGMVFKKASLHCDRYHYKYKEGKEFELLMFVLKDVQRGLRRRV